MRARPLFLLLALTLALTGCGGGDDEPPGAVDADTTKEERLATRDSRFPSIVDVEVAEAAPNVFDFSVTVSSPYDSERRFADGWRIVGDDGSLYGRKRIARPHPDEQPFTLAQRGVRIPRRVTAVHVEGHDSRNGWGGRRYVLALPGRDPEEG